MASQRLATHDSSLGLSLGPVGLSARGLPTDGLPARPAEQHDSAAASVPAGPVLLDITSLAPLPVLTGELLPSLDEMIASEGSAGASIRGRLGLWLAGDALMCACPDCAAPMTVRTFLMTADCWNCGTSIELDEQMEREARRLLAERATQSGDSPSQKRPTSPLIPPPSLVPTVPTAAAVATARAKETPADAAQPTSSAPAARAPHSSAEPSAPSRSAPLQSAPGTNGAAAQPRTPASVASTRRRIRRLTAASVVSAWLSGLFSMTPAWLISAVLHFVVLAILAFIAIPDEDRAPRIVLSSQRSVEREEGDAMHLDANEDAEFDLPVPAEYDLTNPQDRQALMVAEQEARELRVDPDALEPLRPQLADVKNQIGSATAHKTLAARDPRVRIEMVQQEGGTTLTESAVARALRWLASQQKSDGGWSLKGGGSDEAATALALLPFLGAGQTHLNGIYKDQVAGGLRWLVEHQREDGDLRSVFKNSNNGMYAHGQGAIVLCEAFAMEGDERLRAPAQKAVDFIVSAQHSGGGWRYRPGEKGDTSVLGWQLMALRSARVAGLTVPDSTFVLSDRFLDSVQAKAKNQFGYGYISGRSPIPTMTAEGLLCRMYNGWTEDDPTIAADIRWLADNHLPSKNAPNMYYWYYGTQVFHHVGGQRWEQWNRRMRDILVETQEDRGAYAGSWPLRDNHDNAGGRIYTTSLAACTLEVYYRHLPIFRQIKLD